LAIRYLIESPISYYEITFFLSVPAFVISHMLRRWNNGISIAHFKKLKVYQVRTYYNLSK